MGEMNEAIMRALVTSMQPGGADSTEASRPESGDWMSMVRSQMASDPATAQLWQCLEAGLSDANQNDQRSKETALSVRDARRARARERRLRDSLAFLQELIAAAGTITGACRRCLGLNEDCSGCGGRGLPGAQPHDAGAAEWWLGALLAPKHTHSAALSETANDKPH